MNTTIRKEDGKMIATLEGRLDTAASEQAAKDLMALHDCEGYDIILDFSQLTYISSSGLRILLGIRKYAAAVNSRVTLVGVNEDIREVLYTTGFNNLFEIADSEDN